MRVVCRDVIAALEAEQADLNAQLSDPEIFKDYEKAGSLQARAEEIETLLPKNHSSKKQRTVRRRKKCKQRDDFLHIPLPCA